MTISVEKSDDLFERLMPQLINQDIVEAGLGGRHYRESGLLPVIFCDINDYRTAGTGVSVFKLLSA